MGVVSVIYLMEGQPPIVNSDGKSMESVMQNVYNLPETGIEFFTHHASSSEEDEGVSELEDEHAKACVDLIKMYCITPELQEQALGFMDKALELRHKHFDMIYDDFYDSNEPIFKY